MLGHPKRTAPTPECSMLEPPEALVVGAHEAFNGGAAALVPEYSASQLEYTMPELPRLTKPELPSADAGSGLF
eukprot:824016-Alexandrium_andersonii.AAC.1